MNDLFTNANSLVLFVLLAGHVYLIWEITKLKKTLNNQNPEVKKLEMQAYERLSIFVERAGLRNMVTNAEVRGTSAAIFHGVLIQNLKQEYEHNISQQVYVSKEIWQAITKLKDQNIYVLNQLAAMLPPQATSLDLSKRVVEYSIAQPTELHNIVLDALQHEAKQKLTQTES
jgi:hypothetical protein